MILRHDPKNLIFQSSQEYGLSLPKPEYFIINVAKDFNNPRADLWIPYEDFVPINIEDLLKVAQIVKERFDKGQKTLIHCISGEHRSVAFTLASISYIYKVSIEQAMKMLDPPIDFYQWTKEVPNQYFSIKLFEMKYVKP